MLLRFITLFLLLFCTSVSLAKDKQHRTLVVTETAEWSDIIEEIPISGTVISPRTAILSTEVEGLVEVIGVEAGDSVQPGDEILRLKSDLEQLSLEAASAETEEARQALADAQRRLADAKALVKHKTISTNDVSLLGAEVKMKKATLQKLSARENRQALRVRMHTLQAPFGGVIRKRYIEQGEWLSPGQETVELVAIDHLEVDFPVPESVYPKLKKALGLQLRFNLGDDKPYPAKIARVIPVTDKTSRTFNIRAILDTSGPDLIPGLSSSALLRIKSSQKGIVINRNAIQRYPDGRMTVWLIKQQNGENPNHENGEMSEAKVTEKSVESGLSFNGKIQITSGIDAGDWIVTQGNELLREGQSVSIKNR